MINREFKNDLFVKLFSEAENGLSIYNALLGTNYRDASELEIATLDDAVYLHQKNDVAILLSMRLLLLEHQSSINPNMPIRGLQYYAKTIEGYIIRNGLNLYGEKLIKIPAPFYFVLYNGMENAPDKMELHLSDAFEKESSGYEWTATMLNINAGHNGKLLKGCPTLNGYAKLVQYMREGLGEGKGTDDAADQAIRRCIEEGYIVDFLKKHIGEARDMLTFGPEEERIYENALREEAREGMLKDFILGEMDSGMDEVTILDKLQKYFHLPPETAKEYYDRFAVVLA